MENIIQNRVKLPESALDYLCDLVAQCSGRKKVTEGERNEIRTSGVIINVKEGAPSGGQIEEYAMGLLPSHGGPRINLTYMPSRSGHVGLVEGSVVGGTLFGKRFGGLSTTWEKGARGTPRYDLGVAVNKIMLDKFGLEY